MDCVEDREMVLECESRIENRKFGSTILDFEVGNDGVWKDLR